MLNEIHTKLEEFGQEIHYGQIVGTTVQDEWNYFIIGRDSYDIPDSGKMGHRDCYFVIIVHEEHIPEGMAGKVIELIESIPGMRVIKGSHNYDYRLKGNADTVVEMLAIKFCKPQKGL